MDALQFYLMVPMLDPVVEGDEGKRLRMAN